MSKVNWQEAKQVIDDSQHIVVLQAENPDGDSLGSALALEELLSELGKQVTLFCAIDMPQYLRYFQGWDRVVKELPKQFDAAIVVDASIQSLFSQALTPENTAKLSKKPLIIFDHHAETSEEDHLLRRFEQAILINEPEFIATSELLSAWAKTVQIPINKTAAEHMLGAILSDSLGLTSEATSAHTLRTVAELIDAGASIYTIEQRRREFMKKSQEILAYKGRLLERVEYFVNDKLALIHIPWDEIEQYSNAYNPSALVIDEMRLVNDVEVAIAIKTYPDGKITAKLRGNIPVANNIAAAFGGGGHPYAAGFKTFDYTYSELLQELLNVVEQSINDYHKTTTTTEPC